MKVLAAAPYIYRGVEIGFCDCEPGELVRLGDAEECFCNQYQDEDEEGFEDDVCDCHLDAEESPPFLGLASLAGTTTACVEDRDLSDDELRAAVRGGLERAGWLPAGLAADMARALVDGEIAQIERATSVYPVGTLISSMKGFTFRVDDALARAVPRPRR